MSFQDVLADLKEFYLAVADKPYSSKTRLTEEDVTRWSTLIGEPRAVLYDRIASYLALGFYNSELTFEFCDAVVNDIHRIISCAHEERPDLFWQVFLAFDQGEYCHGGNRNEDPVEVYTRPLVAQIVETRLS